MTDFTSAADALTSLGVSATSSAASSVVDAVGAMLTPVTQATQASWMQDQLFRGASPEPFYGNEVDSVFALIFWAAVGATILLFGLIFLFVAQYRRRPGVAPKRSASHNTALEITWTVIPSIFFILLFFLGFRVYTKQQLATGEQLVLDLTGYKWNWEIAYPNGASSSQILNSSDPESDNYTLGAEKWRIFYVPEDTPIRLRMTSSDVIHSFWVPDFRTKFDVIPNRYTSYQFTTAKLTADDTGDAEDFRYRDHWVFCAEYCGNNHSEMGAILRVIPQEEFWKWVRAPYDESMAPAEIGELIYNAKGCVQCHTIDGGSGIGPTWKNLYGYEHDYTDGSVILADDNHLRESISNPGIKIRAGYQNVMAAYAFSELEYSATIAYMRALSDRGGLTGPTGDPSATGGDERESDQNGDDPADPQGVAEPTGPASTGESQTNMPEAEPGVRQPETQPGSEPGPDAGGDPG